MKSPLEQSPEGQNEQTMPSETQAKIPQYKRLAAQMREHIRAGDLKPGDRLPSWAQMRRDYGVNIVTIERAQKELAAEGLLVTRQGSGTFVAEPQSVPVRKGIIGLCGTGITYPAEASVYWTRLVHGVRSAAQSAGHHILLVDNHSTAGWEKVDGMVISEQAGIFPVYKVPDNLPCVSLILKIPGLCSVYCDDGAGIRQAVEHLIASGHRKIGYLHGLEGPPADQRIAAYRGALKSGGISAPEKWMRMMRGVPRLHHQFEYGQQFVETGRDNMRDWLSDGWTELGCTALLAHNDDFALGIIEALQEAGLRVPEDVSVVGFDGTSVASRALPALSTLEVPLEEIGRKGVEILLQQIETDNAAHDDCILPVTLRLGATTTFPSTRDSAIKPDAKGV